MDTNLKDVNFAIEAAGISFWTWDVDSDVITLDDRAFELWGLAPAETVTFEDLSAKIHPADLDKVRAAFAATRERMGSYEMDFRILHKGGVRWISARGKTLDSSVTKRLMHGVFMNASVRKIAEEVREMMAGELHHRMKNLFALASSLTSIAARTTSSKEEMTKDLMQRLKALSEAHGMIRPEPSDQSPARDLGELLSVLLKPYLDADTDHERVSISIPPLLVGENSATAIAMVAHELATNSIKYGALSSPDGKLEITATATDGDVLVKWQERGGPPVATTPSLKGFGQRLVNATVEGQLGGTVRVDWAADGIIIVIRMNTILLGA